MEAYPRVVYLKRPKQPSSVGVDQALHFEAASRNDAIHGFGNSLPRSVFDLERDAEVAEIVRQLHEFKNETARYLKRRYVVEFRVWVAIALVFAVGVCAALYFSLSERSPTPKVPVTSGVVANTSNTAHATQPQQPAKSTSSNTLPVDVVKRDTSVANMAASPTRPNAGPLPTQNDSTHVKYVGNAGRGLVGVAMAQALGAVQVHSDASQKPPLPKAPVMVSKQPVVRPVVEQTVAVAKPVEKTLEKMFAVDEKEQASTQPTKAISGKGAIGPVKAVIPAVVKPVMKSPAKPELKTIDEVTSKPSKPVEPARKEASAKSQEAMPQIAGAPEARHDRFGMSGVITLLPTGIIVYDRMLKMHRTVPVGATLPDGSVLKSIDVKNSRISTDKGDVLYE